MNVEENSSIRCLGSPDGVGYSEHCTCAHAGSMRWPQMKMTVALTGELQKQSSLFASGQRPPANPCEFGTYIEKTKPTKAVAFAPRT